MEKPLDIKFPSVSDLSSVPPFVNFAEAERLGDDLPSIDYSTTCVTYQEIGTCNHGFKCRFLGAHVKKSEDGSYELVNDAEKQARSALTNTELNFVDAESRKLLQRRKVWPTWSSFIKWLTML